MNGVRLQPGGTVIGNYYCYHRPEIMPKLPGKKGHAEKVIRIDV